MRSMDEELRRRERLANADPHAIDKQGLAAQRRRRALKSKEELNISQGLQIDEFLRIFSR
jgi:hypothetical protein